MSEPALQGVEDPKAAARWLIEKGWITPFQAEALLREKPRAILIEDYLLLDRIGAGGMGVVYKARHVRMDRIVALKVLARQVMQTPSAVERFYREVRASAKLHHPNVVLAYDASECQGVHYLVMEYVEGGDLAGLVEREGPMPLGRALRCVRQAAEALAYAHEHGIIHRDVKPANLLMTPSGQVKLLDLGLARLREAEAQGQDLSLTKTGHLLGTAAYMAPEHAANPRHADHRSDIYSLGCTMYRLITGQSPFSGTTVIEVIVAGREQPTPDLRLALNSDPIHDGYLADVQAVFERMLAKRPEDRYQTMGAVIQDLDVLLASLPAELEAVPAAGGASERTIANPRRSAAMAPTIAGTPSLPARANEATVLAGRLPKTLETPVASQLARRARVKQVAVALACVALGLGIALAIVANLDPRPDPHPGPRDPGPQPTQPVAATDPDPSLEEGAPGGNDPSEPSEGPPVKEWTAAPGQVVNMIGLVDFSKRWAPHGGWETFQGKLRHPSATPAVLAFPVRMPSEYRIVMSFTQAPVDPVSVRVAGGPAAELITKLESAMVLVLPVRAERLTLQIDHQAPEGLVTRLTARNAGSIRRAIDDDRRTQVELARSAVGQRLKPNTRHTVEINVRPHEIVATFDGGLLLQWPFPHEAPSFAIRRGSLAIASASALSIERLDVERLPGPPRRGELEERDDSPEPGKPRPPFGPSDGEPRFPKLPRRDPPAP